MRRNITASPDQKLGKATLPAINFTEGRDQVPILFEPKSHLPAAIRTRDDDNISGDSNYDLVLSDWKPVNGVQVAHTLTYNLDDVPVGKVTFTDVKANPAIAANAFTPTDAVKSAAKGPATGYVPYQWVLRRIALGRYLDADTLFYPPSGAAQCGRSRSQRSAVGHRHGEQPRGQHEGRPRGVRRAAGRSPVEVHDRRLQAKIPGQADQVPHPHPPTTWTTPAACALMRPKARPRGPGADKAYFEKDLKTTHTVAPDAYQKNPKKVQIGEVKDQTSLKDADGTRSSSPASTIRMSTACCSGHVVKDNVVWVTDLYSPGRDTARPLARRPSPRR